MISHSGKTRNRAAGFRRRAKAIAALAGSLPAPAPAPAPALPALPPASAPAPAAAATTWCAASTNIDVLGGLAFQTSHRIKARDHRCQIVRQDAGHPVFDGAESARFEVQAGDCSATASYDDCAQTAAGSVFRMGFAMDLRVVAGIAVIHAACAKAESEPSASEAAMAQKMADEFVMPLPTEVRLNRAACVYRR